VSRPKNPSLATWAVGNFGVTGNPWDNLAKRLAPGGNEITPRTLLSARVYNYIFGDLVDAVNNLFAMGGQRAALNWPLRSSTTNQLKRAVYSTKECAWYAVGEGGNDFFERSLDYGRTWTSLSASLANALACYDVAVNPNNGNVVIINQGTRNVYKGTWTAYATQTWAVQVNALSGVPSVAGIDWENTAAKFLCVYRVGATGMRVDFSGDGVTWTACSTMPAGWTGYAGAQEPVITCIPGRTIAAFFDDTGGLNKVRVLRSTDGGANWTEVQVTLAIAAATWPTSTILSKPAYNPVRDAWYISVSKTASGRASEVIESLDGGATWTTRFSDNNTKDVAWQELQAIGELLIATNDDGRIYYSSDRGATWRFSHRNVITSAARPYLRAGGGGVLAMHSADKLAFTTSRMGDSGTLI
jgi:photosystem II stability/assembly factor-like uncharacterized protein